MACFIDKDGKVRLMGAHYEPFNLEEHGIENYFVNHVTAQEIRNIILKRYPLAFYGKHY